MTDPYGCPPATLLDAGNSCATMLASTLDGTASNSMADSRAAAGRAANSSKGRRAAAQVTSRLTAPKRGSAAKRGPKLKVVDDDDASDCGEELSATLERRAMNRKTQARFRCAACRPAGGLSCPA